MSINLEYSVLAKCTPEQAWKRFKEMEQWADWNRVVGKAEWLEGEPWEQGSRFALDIVRPWSMSLEPEIIEVAPPNVVHWRGGGALMSGDNRFIFEHETDGLSRLHVAGEFSGVGTLFWSDNVKSGILRMFAEWLGALKAEAEKIAREEAARA